MLILLQFDSLLVSVLNSKCINELSKMLLKCLVIRRERILNQAFHFTLKVREIQETKLFTENSRTSSGSVHWFRIGIFLLLVRFQNREKCISV